MLNLQRKLIPVQIDQRQCPRVEFHTPVILMGLSEKGEIVDFSQSGLFVQMDSSEGLKEGQQVHLAFRFPHEKQCTVIKGRIVRTEKDGFACQFVDLDPPLYELLERSFDFLSTTLPLECSDQHG
jgi:hypothetical protein